MLVVPLLASRCPDLVHKKDFARILPLRITLSLTCRWEAGHQQIQRESRYRRHAHYRTWSLSWIVELWAVAAGFMLETTVTLKSAMQPTSIEGNTSSAASSACVSSRTNSVCTASSVGLAAEFITLVAFCVSRCVVSGSMGVTGVTIGAVAELSLLVSAVWSAALRYALAVPLDAFPGLLRNGLCLHKGH